MSGPACRYPLAEGERKRIKSGTFQKARPSFICDIFVTPFLHRLNGCDFFGLIVTKGYSLNNLPMSTLVNIGLRLE